MKQEPYRIESFDYDSGPRTPWGHADMVWHFDEDVKEYATPGHGGFHITGEALKRIPAQYHTSPYHPKGTGWFEEDCEWAIVARYLPEFFTDEEREHAEQVIKTYNYDTPKGFWVKRE